MIPEKHDIVQQATQRWLEKAVIGLNLCPFAKAVHVKNQIRYAISDATDIESLHQQLMEEIEFLLEADAEQVETTLFIFPNVLNDFLDFNDFLDVAEALLDDLNAEGILQIASFHPDYQFAGTRAEDIDNFTNRAPYPTLHLIREASIERVVASYPDTDSIYQNNIALLRKMGLDGWRKLFTD